MDRGARCRHGPRDELLPGEAEGWGGQDDAVLAEEASETIGGRPTLRCEDSPQEGGLAPGVDDDCAGLLP